MRIKIQPFKLIQTTAQIALFLLIQPAFADGGEDYYKAIRKLKKFDPVTMNEIKKRTVDAEQINKVNALARKNKEHNARIEAIKVTKPVVDPNESKAPSGPPTKDQAKGSTTKITSTTSNAPEVKTITRKERAPKTSTSSTTSAPVKVDSDAPDELNFPGTDE